jgi:hypothetical protein
MIPRRSRSSLALSFLFNPELAGFDSPPVSNLDGLCSSGFEVSVFRIARNLGCTSGRRLNPAILGIGKQQNRKLSLAAVGHPP